MADLLVLVHSPLVGPATWDPVAKRLTGRGYEVSVPDLNARAAMLGVTVHALAEIAQPAVRRLGVSQRARMLQRDAALEPIP